MSDKTIAEALTAGVILVIIVVVLALVGSQWFDCESIGRVFVRGVIWFKCIK